MPETPNRSYHHGDLRRALIDTAMDMLREAKSWQFTLREVARRAGVSHAAPYKHFPDKAALLTEMSLIGFDQLKEALTLPSGKTRKPLRTEIFAMAKRYMDFATGNPGLYRLMFSAEAGKGPEVHLSERALAALGVVVEVLERGQTDGQIRKRDVQGQTTACWAQMHGLALLSLDGLLLPEKVGPNAVKNALTTLLEGLEQ